MTSTLATPAPFSRIKIRTGALVFCGDDVALIRRDCADSTHYTPPGGNVEDGEDLYQALARELALGKDVPCCGPVDMVLVRDPVRDGACHQPCHRLQDAEPLFQ
ncbi:NUDIX hydrolase [Streptomyces sp. NPDC048257]|uniref:NUDIX hydrolase n=1 Tax=Streptomyces sp. NPDC048257 TaxID=3365526 RepID=UPI0037135018